MIPFVLIIAMTLFFFILERILPGRELPESPGWYRRSAFLNLCQVGVILLAGVAWNHWLQSSSLFHISRAMPPFLQGPAGFSAPSSSIGGTARGTSRSFSGASAIKCITALHA